MGQLKIYGQKTLINNFQINAIVKTYPVAADETIIAGDLIIIEEGYVKKATTGQFDGVAKTPGTGAASAIIEIYTL